MNETNVAAKRVWSESDIVCLLQSNPVAVERAIVVLYEKGQTHDEQVTDSTRHDNNVGFNAADARRLSFIAKFLLLPDANGCKRHLKRETNMRYLPRVMKYRKQLAAYANSR